MENNSTGLIIAIRWINWLQEGAVKDRQNTYLLIEVDINAVKKRTLGAETMEKQALGRRAGHQCQQEAIWNRM